MSLKKTSFPYYQVREGENLNTISKKFKISATKILIDNQVAPKDVKCGRILVLKKD